MRLIHDVTFSAQEYEFYRQLVFSNLTQGMKAVIEALEDMDLHISDDNEDIVKYINYVENAPDIKDGQPFPTEYLSPLRKLWQDETIQKCLSRGNEAALPDKYADDTLSPLLAGFNRGHGSV